MDRIVLYISFMLKVLLSALASHDVCEGEK